MYSDNDRRLGVIVGKLRSTGMALDGVAIHAEALQCQAMVAIRLENKILNGVLGSSDGRKTDKRFGELNLFGESLSDGF